MSMWFVARFRHNPNAYAALFIPKGDIDLKQLHVYLIVLLVLGGCATYGPSIPPAPVPETYSGPVVSVTDSAIPDSRYKGLLFGLMEIDGKAIDNVFEATRRSSQANATPFRRVEAGFLLYSSVVTRRVPVRPMKVRLRASHATGAPIHAVFSAVSGDFVSVEGSVEFAPEVGHEYVVTGILSSNNRSVWIEDIATGEPATKKVQIAP